MKDILKYIDDGINIRKNNYGDYTIFTIPTQHFKVDSLEELTPARFEKEIENQKERCELEKKLTQTYIKNQQEIRKANWIKIDWNSKECVYKRAWSNENCGKDCEVGICNEHKDKLCSVCGSQAVIECSGYAGSFVCGGPLCEKCKHNH